MQKKMKILAISILIFCVVTVSSKPWIYMDSNEKWFRGCKFFGDVRAYPWQYTTSTSEPTFPEWVQSRNEIQDNIENKINEKIEDNVRNEIDDNAENATMPPPEKIILTNEDIK